jgi:hypothetical protein
VIDPLHVSDLRWDRWLAGELGPDDAAGALAHAAACAACGARMRELSAERDAFARRPVVVSFAPPRPVPRARGIALAGATAIAAAVLVLAVWRGSGEEPGDRVKGGAQSLVLAAGRAPDLIAVSTGDVVRTGESLQAAYTADRDGFGAVLALDGAGAANAYVPARGDVMVGLPAGVERSFPASTTLDQVTGPERIILLWCRTALPLAPLLGELRTTGDVVSPAGCRVRRVVLDKRAAVGEPRALDPAPRGAP